jgi:hypothetical protein
LDFVGLVPGFGESVDLVNAGISGLRGDYVNAGLSTSAAIPFVGWGATLGKLENKVEGIYQFTASSGKTYIGQSSNIAQRVDQHIASGKLARVTPVQTTEVLGGKMTREIAEQLKINELGGINNLENIRNPIGSNRQYLLPNP